MIEFHIFPSIIKRLTNTFLCDRTRSRDRAWFEEYSSATLIHRPLPLFGDDLIHPFLIFNRKRHDPFPLLPLVTFPKLIVKEQLANHHILLHKYGQFKAIHFLFRPYLQHGQRILPEYDPTFAFLLIHSKLNFLILRKIPLYDLLLPLDILPMCFLRLHSKPIVLNRHEGGLGWRGQVEVLEDYGV